MSKGTGGARRTPYVGKNGRREPGIYTRSAADGSEARDIVIPTFGQGMAMWREKLFASMHRNSAAAADFLYLPSNRIVELGAKVEI